MKKITQLFKRLSKKVKVISLVIASTAVLGGVAYAGFSPANRPVFDWNNPDDRKGSLTGPVFNSFINTPDYGDERAFFDASLTAANGTYKDVLPGVTGDSDKIVTLRTYVHNNANQTTNDGVGVAQNTKVRIDLPTGTSTMLRARSYISASNSTPGEVTDTTELVDTSAFSISYVPGSAKIYSNAHKSGVGLDDTIVTSGATIGSDVLNGIYLGCFEYASTVEIQVRINTSAIEVDKKVRLAGQTDFVDKVAAKPGDKIQWAIFVKNSGSATLNDINVRDVLPPHVSLNSGSVKWYDASQNGAVQGDKPLFDGGINFGAYGAGSNFYVRFSTQALGDFEGCEITLRNLTFVKSKEFKVEKQDQADVIITKENCTEPEKLVVCENLIADKLTLKKGESTKLTAQGKATNTSITGYIFTVNGTEVKNSNSANDNTYTLTAGNEAQYEVKATVKSPIGNVTSANCKKTIKVQEDKIVVCDSLTANKYAVLPGEKVTFKAKGSATNTTITEYEFVLNGVKGGQSASDTYEYTATKAGTYFVRVYIHSVDGQRVTSDKCVKSVDVEEESMVVCESLTSPKLSLKKGESTTLTANASAKNATITGYIFTVNGSEVQNSASKTYEFKGDKAGEYDIAVEVVSSVGSTTSSSCVKTVDVLEKIVPIYRCESFTLNKNKVLIGERFTATARITAKDGATFKMATFTFGDEATDQDKMVTNDIKNGVVTVDHSYSKTGNYGPRVSLVFDVNGETKTVEDPACVAQITVSKTEVKGVKLPDTGAGSIVGIMGAVTAAGATLHRRFTLKRSR